MHKNIADIVDGDLLAGGVTAKRDGEKVELWSPRGYCLGVVTPAQDGSTVLTLAE
jgi:hypothetical protein